MRTRKIRSLVSAAGLAAILLAPSCATSRSAASEVTSAQGGVSDVLRGEIFAARDRIWRAWFANDRPTLERMLPPEFVGLGYGGGPWDDRASALAGAAGFQESGGRLVSLSFSGDRIQAFGEVVTVFSNYRLELAWASESQVQAGRATEVFVLRDGVWINPAWHLDSVE
jgi:uncharacterized protein DUF4440